MRLKLHIFESRRCIRSPLVFLYNTRHICLFGFNACPSRLPVLMAKTFTNLSYFSLSTHSAFARLLWQHNEIDVALCVIFNAAHTHIHAYDGPASFQPILETIIIMNRWVIFIIHTKTSVLEGTFISLMGMNSNVLQHRILYILSLLCLVYQREDRWSYRATVSFLSSFLSRVNQKTNK